MASRNHLVLVEHSGKPILKRAPGDIRFRDFSKPEVFDNFSVDPLSFSGPMDQNI
jgi:hypothetical protein